MAKAERSVLLLTVLALLTGISGAAHAQSWPTRSVTFVVPYAAGGNVDVSARILQNAIGDTLGQPVVVENRAGAGGTLAGEYVARSAPDGHTIFIGSNGPVMLGPMTMPRQPYQWDKVFAPVSMLAVATNMLTVRTSLPVKSVTELVAYAKANPGKLTVGNSGTASINHFMGELFKLKAGITWVEVAYRGNAPAINDLIAGHVDMGLQQLVDTLGHIEAGKLTALAVLGPSRSAALPNVPTMVEAGYPDVQGVTWNGLFAPIATPPDVVDKLSAAVRAALSLPAARDRLAAVGSEARSMTPTEFKTFLNADQRKWSEVMRQANIKVAP